MKSETKTMIKYGLGILRLIIVLVIGLSGVQKIAPYIPRKMSVPIPVNESLSRTSYKEVQQGTITVYTEPGHWTDPIVVEGMQWRANIMMNDEDRVGIKTDQDETIYVGNKENIDLPNSVKTVSFNSTRTIKIVITRKAR